MSDYRSTETTMYEIGKAIDDLVKVRAGENFGFVAIVFPFNESGGISNYISNGKRADIINVLRHTADRIESRAVIPPVIGGVQ